jgi:hypothetical protein
MTTKFIITEEQVNEVLQILGEVPAKFSFKAIALLNSGLSKIEEEPEEDNGNITEVPV